MYPTEPVQHRVWIRGVFELPSGRQVAQRAPARSVRREYIVHPGDVERTAIIYDDLLEELQSVGYDFPEGHGTLVEILGSMTDALP
jgi:hypothetical protein